MKRLILVLLALSAVSPARATFDVPYIVYTLEKFEPGDGIIAAIPHKRFLTPHVYTDNMGSGPDTYIEFILRRLKELNPSLYRGTKLVKVVPDQFPLKRVVFSTTLTDKKKFMVVASELVCSLSSSFESFDRVVVVFHFKDKKLEEIYGGQEFTYDDVPYSAFVLKRPIRKK
jgi:hypothetical protein